MSDDRALLDDEARLAALDPHGARRALAGFPAQCRRALGLAPVPALAGSPPGRVVVAAMGGSAAGGDVVALCASERLDLPVQVHRDYGLPRLGPDALVVVMSYSGETAEALSAFGAARAAGLRAAVVTSGGSLAAAARTAGCPLVLLPSGLMPRMALGYLVLPALRLLEAVGLPVVGPEELGEALEVVEALTLELDGSSPSASNPAKRLALAIGRRFPVIYGGPRTGTLAYRWRTDLAENAKSFAISGALPEVNHNEIEAWGKPGVPELHLVLLRDADEPAAIAERFAALRGLVEGAASSVSEAAGRGRSRLARALSLAYLGQWVSYYVAVLRGHDPWVVPLVETFKRRIGGEPRDAC